MILRTLENVLAVFSIFLASFVGIIFAFTEPSRITLWPFITVSWMALFFWGRQKR